MRAVSGPQGQHFPLSTLSGRKEQEPSCAGPGLRSSWRQGRVPLSKPEDAGSKTRLGFTLIESWVGLVQIWRQRSASAPARQTQPLLRWDLGVMWAPDFSVRLKTCHYCQEKIHPFFISVTITRFWFFWTPWPECFPQFKCSRRRRNGAEPEPWPLRFAVLLWNTQNLSLLKYFYTAVTAWE